MHDADGIPVAMITRIGRDFVRVKCPFCTKTHIHTPWVGERVAHCLKGDYKIRPSRGTWFHMFKEQSDALDDVLEYQGQILDVTPRGELIVQLYDFLSGGPGRQATLHSERHHIRIYADNVAMRSAYDTYSERKRHER